MKIHKLIIRMFSRFKKRDLKNKINLMSDTIEIKTPDRIPDFLVTKTVDSNSHPLSFVKVRRVLDGDTIIISDQAQEVKIRLFGIDCPEGGQAWGNRAKSGLVKLIGGKMVYLETHGVDHYNRTLATIYVHANGHLVNVNEKLVVQGHAWVLRRYYATLPKDRQIKLNQLESWAKRKRVGLWKVDNPTPPWQWRSQKSA